MARNYDTTHGTPYVRVSEIRMRYAEDGSVTGEYVEQVAVVTDGQVRYLKEPETYHTFNRSRDDLLDAVPLIHPATGAPLGGSVTGQQAMMSVFALIRADQLARDAAQD